MAISYHNLGNEEEFIGNRENAKDCFQKSAKMVAENFGTGHKLFLKFSKHLAEFLQVSSYKIYIFMFVLKRLFVYLSFLLSLSFLELLKE